MIGELTNELRGEVIKGVFASGGRKNFATCTVTMKLNVQLKGFI